MRGRTRDRLCLIIGGTALLAATLLLGGVFRWTQAVVAILIALALGTQVASRRKLDGTSPIVVLLGIAIGLTALQLVPLPASVVAFLNPSEAALVVDGARLAGTSPWTCLSMDPAGTLRGLFYLVILLGVALLALRLAVAERGRFVLLGGVAIACGLVAATTAIHAIVSADEIYGVYSVVNREAVPIIGPLVNQNHLGCLMAFGTTIALGLAFYEKQTALWRAVWVVIVVLCTAIALLSESRGAAIALIIGVFVTLALIIARRLGDVTRGRRRNFANHLPIALVLVVGFGLAVYSSAGGVAEQLGRTTLSEIEHPASKFAAWKAASELISESPWVGVGRGAVEPTFTHVFAPSAYVTFSHLENEYVQAVVEWGVPGAIVLACALGWCVITALRRWREGPLAAAALGGLAAVMFQSSVDFGIELLGVSIPVTIVACTVQLVPLRETSGLARLRALRIGLVALLALGAVALFSDWTTTVAEDHDAELAIEAPKQADVVDAITRHPLDYFSFGVVGETLLDAGDDAAVAYLNHALRLNPFHPGLHRFAARMLIGMGHKDQAAIEYSLAMAGAAPHRLLTEIVHMLPDAADAASAIPIDYPNPDSILHSLVELERQDVAEKWLERVAIEHNSQNLDLLDTLYALAFERKDYAVALRAAETRLVAANTPTSRLMHARIKYVQQDYAAVYTELADVQTWPGRIDERADAWLIVCDAYRDQGRWNDALKCIHQLDGTGTMALRRSDITDREGDIADRRQAEVRTKQIQELERTMNLPVDTALPVIHGAGSAANDPIPNPLTAPLPPAIQNPIRNPLDSH